MTRYQKKLYERYRRETWGFNRYTVVFLTAEQLKNLYVLMKTRTVNDFLSYNPNDVLGLKINSRDLICLVKSKREARKWNKIYKQLISEHNNETYNNLINELIEENLRANF